MLFKFRNWLLVKMAGRSTIVINATINGGGLVIQPNQFNSLIYNTRIMNADVGVHLPPGSQYG